MCLDGTHDALRDVPCEYEYRTELAGMPEYLRDERLTKRWDGLRRVWRTAYPGVDVLAEVRRAYGKEMGGAVNKKTDHAKYLTNWLAKAQQWAASNAARKPASEDYSWMDSPKPVEGAGA